MKTRLKGLSEDWRFLPLLHDCFLTSSLSFEPASCFSHRNSLCNIWFIMGAVFRWSRLLPKRLGILPLHHFGIMILSFALLANLAGFFQEKNAQPDISRWEFYPYLSDHFRRHLHHTYRKIQKISQRLIQQIVRNKSR